MNFLDRLPSEPAKRRWIAIGVSFFISMPLALWCIYDSGNYGIALFLLIPFFIGLVSTIVFGYGRFLRKRDAAAISFLSLTIFSVGLIVFAIEGLICIAMASPIAIPLTLIGSLIGRLISNKSPSSTLIAVFLAIVSIPTTSFIEKASEVELFTVSTSLIIDADIQTVWENVIEFPPMDEPKEFIFRAGISYPIDSDIKGTGKGAIRYCNFNTGSFVEPITEWREPTILRFDVLEQPVPMTEYSLWDINAPHLHDYFVSEKGEFKLRELPNGQTELVGTTLYRHNIKPSVYWKIWSDWIIHSIHHRVLNHIKVNAEQAISNQKKVGWMPSYNLCSDPHTTCN